MSDLDFPYPDRRGPDRPSNDYKGILKRRMLPKGPARAVFIGVAITIIASTLIGAWRSLPAVVIVPRFLTDSIRRDQREARRDSIIARIDNRVGALYCNSLDRDQREACREQVLQGKIP